MATVPTHEVADAGASRVAAVVAKHERTLVRVARQASLCDDDAYDAYQRALEIFLRRVDTVDPATEVAWLRVVTLRHARRTSGRRPGVGDRRVTVASHLQRVRAHGVQAVVTGQPIGDSVAARGPRSARRPSPRPPPG